MKSWRCKVSEVLYEAFRKGRRPVSANDIPKINEALEEASSLIKRGWTQDAHARAKNDLEFLRNLQKAFDDGADIDVDHEADIAGHTPLSYDDPRAVCWSIEGAVWLAAKKRGLTEELGEILLCRICASIIETDYIYTTPTVDTLDKYLIIDYFISEWNDMYDRTKEEVLAILKAAQIQGGADEG